MNRKFIMMLLYAIFILTMPTVFANTDEGKSVPYFSRMQNYYVCGNADRDFDDFKFMTSEGYKAVEGKKYQADYYIKDDKPAASPLQILRNYENAVRSMGGIKLFDGEVDDRVGRIATFKVVKGAKQLWLDVQAYNDGNAYTVTLIENEAMRQDVTAN